MRRYLPVCVLAVLFASLSGCGDAPSRPSVITDRPVTPPKTSARYIQVPWDISLFFTIPGGAIVVGATGAATAATPDAAAEGDNLTGTFVNSNGFAGTLTGVLTGNLETGTFTGSLKTIMASGCPAERQFTGPVNTQTLNWSPGPHINDCGGASPLTTSLQVAAAPPSAPPPCTYSSAVSATSFPATGGSGTVTVTAGAGCNWFATSSAGFVTLSAAQGTANGTVNFTVAAHTSTTARTATLVVAGQSFTITQAGAACTYALNDTGRTFEAAGALGGVDMRAPAGCAWTAVSDAPWLTFTSGSAGSGDGAINFAVAANPGVSQRVGRITAQGQTFTVTQSGISCVYTVTPPATTGFPSEGGTGSVSVATQPACGWAATSNVPWITVNAPAGGTGDGSVTFTVAGNSGGSPRTGVLTVAGREISIGQEVTCGVSVHPSQTAFPATGGAGTIMVVGSLATCIWRSAGSNVPWITSPPTAGTGFGSVHFTVAANTETTARTGTITISRQTVTITQAGSTTSTLSGTVTNSLNGNPVPGAQVAVGSQTAVTGTNGTYLLTDVPMGQQVVRTTAALFVARSDTVNVTFQTTHNVVLTPATPVLSFAYNANPVFPNDSDRHCGDPNWCWSYTNILTETGGTSVTVITWEINLYDQQGVLEQHTVYTQADFQRFYGGMSGVPANGTVTGGGVVWFRSSSGGAIEIIISGRDAFQRDYRFVASPRLSARERPTLGTPLRAAPDATAPSAPRPRPRGGQN